MTVRSTDTVYHTCSLGLCKPKILRNGTRKNDGERHNKEHRQQDRQHAAFVWAICLLSATQACKDQVTYVVFSLLQVRGGQHTICLKALTRSTS